MTDETRKDQEKKDELTEKDLDQASGGHGTNEGANRSQGEHKILAAHPTEGKR